ncbi:hypothetical protein [Rubidibacter lacunae]|nr:hypothetical protein [Rubidibacter lacunae]
MRSPPHFKDFCCSCRRASPAEARGVWLNRSAPVIREDYCRQCQEFLLMQIQTGEVQLQQRSRAVGIHPKAKEIGSLATKLQHALHQSSNLVVYGLPAS